jgi:hypothetical protein
VASADLANLAAAVTAGYAEVVTVGSDARYVVLLEKSLVGDPDGGSGQPFRAYGTGGSQATAETQALAALNQKRLQRYGADTGAVSNGKKNGNPHVRDLT